MDNVISVGDVVESEYLKGFWRVIDSFSDSVIVVNISDSEIAVMVSDKIANSFKNVKNVD